MKKIITASLVSLMLLAGIFFLAGCAQSMEGGSADPQKLMIPRWFLSELTLDGQKVEIPVGQQQITLRFEEGGKANGNGGCNSFGTDYKAGKDGKLSFGQITSTLMACDNMLQESAYLEALARVQQFKVEEGKLTLSSADGKTAMVFTMPPK